MIDFQKIHQLYDDCKFDEAFLEVSRQLDKFPGNVQLKVLWAGLAQLQENPSHSLDEIKRVIQEAMELDDESPIATMEMGHYLNAVEDNVEAAEKMFCKAVHQAKQILIYALLGQAACLLELGKSADIIREAADLLEKEISNESGTIWKNSD
jgi:predicted Zn-dependent protease